MRAPSSQRRQYVVVAATRASASSVSAGASRSPAQDERAVGAVARREDVTAPDPSALDPDQQVCAQADA